MNEEETNLLILLFILISDMVLGRFRNKMKGKLILKGQNITKNKKIDNVS